MFGKRRATRPSRAARQRAHASHRHGRRPIRSSLTGPGLLNPDNRMLTFKRTAGAVIQYLQYEFPELLEGVNVGFATMPIHKPGPNTTSTEPMFYEIDRNTKTIVLYRMPIQRFKGLHVNDDDHRRMFIEHCAYRAICEYLDVSPWELIPGRFDHY